MTRNISDDLRDRAEAEIRRWMREEEKRKAAEKQAKEEAERKGKTPPKPDRRRPVRLPRP